MELSESKYSYSSSAIPVLVGAKYYFMPKGGFYGHGSVRSFLLFNSVDVPRIPWRCYIWGGEASDSDSEFAFSFGAGYELPLSAKLILDLSGAFLLISDANNIGVRAGVKWGL